MSLFFHIPIDETLHLTNDLQSHITSNHTLPMVQAVICPENVQGFLTV